MNPHSQDLEYANWVQHLAKQMHELKLRSLELLKMPRQDTFLGRKTPEPFPAEDPIGTAGSSEPDPKRTTAAQEVRPPQLAAGSLRTRSVEQPYIGAEKAK
jgi:hypothetical protein